MGVERSTLFFDIFSRLTGRGFKDVERQAEAAEDAVEDLNDANSRLAKSTPESVRQLREQKKALGDVSSEAYKAKHALNDVGKGGGGRHRLEDLLPGDVGGKPEKQGHGIGVRLGAAMARGMAAALVDGSGMIGRALASIPPQAQAGIVAALATVGVAAGAALNAAILATLSGGAVAAGVALAARDPRVKQAGAELGQELLSGLEKQSKSFVPVTLHAIDIVRSEFREAGGDIEKFFEAASAHVEPLTKGLTGLVTGALPGVTKAIENSGPAVDALADGFGRMGQSIGDSLALLSSASGGASEGLRDLFTVMDVGLRTTSLSIAGFSNLYDWLDVIKPTWLLYAEAQNRGNVQTGIAAEAMRRLRGETGPAAEKQKELTAAVQAYLEAQKQLLEDNTKAFDATTRFHESLAKAKEVAAESGKVFTANGEILKGNVEGWATARDSLQGVATDTLGVYNATVKLSGSQGVAQKIMATGYNTFIAVATALGMDKKAADAFARSLGLIPPVKNVDIKLHTGEAISAAQNLKNKIDAIKNKNVTVGVYYRYYNAGPGLGNRLHVPGGNILEGLNRWGGVYEHAQTGLVRLREAGMFSPKAPARYGFAEPSTRGEAFVPRSGNRRRSLSILSQAAGWYGADLVTGQQMMAAHPAYGGSAREKVVRVVIEGTGMLAGLRKEIRIQGGNVQEVLGA